MTATTVRLRDVNSSQGSISFGDCPPDSPANCSKIVVVAQEWPCWLLAALALGLPVAVVFVQAQFHALFAHLVGDAVAWRTLKEWSNVSSWPSVWDNCTVFGTGKADFLRVVLHKLSHRVGLFIYSMDMVFTGH